MTEPLQTGEVVRMDDWRRRLEVAEREMRDLQATVDGQERRLVLVAKMARLRLWQAFCAGAVVGTIVPFVAGLVTLWWVWPR